ncbi:MAG: DUF402 domain-containing protein [Dehalococcoidia bacterium]|nr:DUF402 domain-containing protein [Dehalococcoidia bacterium]
MAREHTPGSEPAASPRPIIERKTKPDGSERTYPCELVHLAPTFAVIRFHMQIGGTIFGTPIAIPPNSVSDGWFWRNRPYNLYRMRGPDGAILAHRFDAVTDVRLSPDEVAYRDLVLDWWVAADDTLIEEDRDELEELIGAGALTIADAERAEEAARLVFSRYRHIIDDVAKVERQLGINQ